METLLEHLLAGGLEQFFAWVVASGGLAAVIPLGIEALKRWERFSWLDQYTHTANRVVAVIIAAAGTAAISYSYDGAVGQFVVSGVTPLALAKFLLNIATQFGVQQLVYTQILKRVVK